MADFWSKVKVKVAEGWKAVVALALPILLGALAQIIDGLGDWVLEQGFTWGGIAVGVLTSISVWLKKNRPPGSGVV